MGAGAEVGTLSSELIHRNPPFTARVMVACGSKRDEENSMLDIIIVALGLGFFLAAIGYTYACERL
jgi:hypothetical protein